MATTSLKRVPTSLVIREMPTQTKVNDTNLQMAKELNRNLSKEDTQKKKTKRRTDHQVCHQGNAKQDKDTPLTAHPPQRPEVTTPKHQMLEKR